MLLHDKYDMMCYDMQDMHDDKYGMIRTICYVRSSMFKPRLCMSRYRRLYLLSESSLSYVYAVGKQPDSNG